MKLYIIIIKCHVLYINSICCAFLYDRQHSKFVYIALQTYITLGYYAMMVVIGNKDC